MPVSVTVPVPLPPIVAVPPDTVSVPLVTPSVTVMLLPPASTSAIDSPVIALVVSSVAACAPGMVFTGASFTGLTFTVEATDSAVVLTPPLAVPPLSTTCVRVTTRLPSVGLLMLVFW